MRPGSPSSLIVVIITALIIGAVGMFIWSMYNPSPPAPERGQLMPPPAGSKPGG